MRSVTRMGAAASTEAHMAGWIASCVLHGALAVGAFIFTQQIQLAPQPTPFKWNVSMVAPQKGEVTTPTPSSSPSSNPAQAVKPLTPLSQPTKQPAQSMSSSQLDLSRIKPVQAISPSTTPKIPPSPPPQQQSSIAEPPPPVPTIATPPPTAQPVIQERPSVRPLDPPPPLPAQTESAPALAQREQAPRPEIRPVSPKPSAPTVAPPAPVTPQASEPPIAATPTQPLAQQLAPTETIAPLTPPTTPVPTNPPAPSKEIVATSQPIQPVTTSPPVETTPPITAQPSQMVPGSPAEREQVRSDDSAPPLGVPSQKTQTAGPLAEEAPQVASIPSTPPTGPTRRDYSWLSDTISRRVEELKHYPAEARLDRAEGRVIIKAVLRADGSVDDVEVFQSSGYHTLDQAAVDLVKRASPFQLPRPLGKSKMTVKIPMSYQLEP